METLKQYKPNKLQMAVILCASIYGEYVLHQHHTTPSLPSIGYSYQIDQAQELMSADELLKMLQNKSDAKSILKFVHSHLPKKYKSDAQGITETIILEAKRHQLDPMFLMAVIMTESSFNPDVVGGHGELGLMQIMPKSGPWLAKRLKIKGTINLKDPKTNIRLGAYYLGKLRHKFEGIGNRYMAAYNMGSKNVNKLVRKKKEPRIYSDKVLAHYSRIYQTVQKPNYASSTHVALNN